MQLLRRSFAAKLVVFVVAVIVVSAALLAALLILNQTLRTRDLERNAAQSALQDFRGKDIDPAGTNAVARARHLAAFPGFRSAFDPNNVQPVLPLLSGAAFGLNGGEYLVLLDASGKPFVAEQGLGPGQAPVPVTDLRRWNGLELIGLTGRGVVQPQGYIEYGGSNLELDGISPVSRDDKVAGYVLDSVDLQTLVQSLRSSGGVQYSIFYGGKRAATTLGGGLVGQPLPAGVSSGGVQSSSFGFYRIGARTYASVYGSLAQSDRALGAVDIDDSIFSVALADDNRAVLSTVILLVTVLSVAAVYFANRMVLRPLSALAHGASRVAAGDYSTRVVVASNDDFGRLATSFNAMTARIRGNTAQLEDQRARLDAALTTLSVISRALTTTTAGRRTLEVAVVEAVIEVSGARVAAMYEAGKMTPAAVSGATVTEAARLGGAADIERVFRSDEVSWRVLPDSAQEYRGWSVVVAPMLYQGETVGAIAAFDPLSLEAVDLSAFTVLANQAAVALENAELFQRERETVERLRELDSMKSDFLATIQHELRTPLTAIIGMTDLMEMTWGAWTQQQQLDALGDVQLAAKGLYDLVETILDYSLIASERVRLSLAPCGVLETVEQALDELAPLVQKSKADVSIQVAPSLRVEADQRRLMQIVKALLDNALKFSEGAPRVRVRAARRDGRVAIQVIDHGIGIEPDNRERIFDRFYQVDNSATRRYGGTGMGLALAQKLVELHHGSIEVESKPGSGSTFTVLLQAGSSSSGDGQDGAQTAPQPQPKGKVHRLATRA